MAMVSRTISLVNRYELKIAGCCHKDAIAFGDVDNDGVNELVVGTYNGVLFIYKAGVIAPWRRASGLGVVVAIAIGDIFNVGRNSLVVVSAEGMCNIFDNIKPPASEDRRSKDGNGKTFANCRHKGRFKSADDGLKPVYVQRIQANVRNALLVDATGDGRVELIVSLTDRVVRTYRWTPGYCHVPGDSSTSTSAGSTASLASGNGTVTVAVSASGAAITPLPPGGGNSGAVVLNNAGENPGTPAAPTPGAVPIEVMNAMAAGSNGTVAAGSISIGVGVSVSDGKVLEDPTYIGHLAGIHKWDLGSHLHSITIHHEPEQPSSPVDFFGELEAKREEEGDGASKGSRKRILRPSDQIYLLLSQPGGDLLRFSFRAADTHGMPSGSTAEGENSASDLDLVFQRLPAPSRIKNHHISCVVLGDVLMPSSTGGGHVLGYCIVSLDGTIILFQNNLERWHLTVDDELFAVSKVDVTGDGYDEIVACGWSGNTYIVNHKKECVRFVLDEPACNFTAGPFGPGNAPCFVYGTFKSRLLVYPNVKISHMLPTNLADQLNQPQNSPLKETLEGLLKRSSGQPEAATDEEIPLEFRTDLVSCFRRLSTPLAHLRSGPSDQEEGVPSSVANYPSFLPLETPRIFTDRTPDVKKAADMAELISELLYGDGKECVRRMNYYEKMRQLKVELRKKEVSLRPRPRSRSV